MKDMPAYPLRTRRKSADPMRPRIMTKWLGPNKLLVQAPGTEVAISINEIDALGNPMTAVKVEAQGDRYSRKEPWWIEGKAQLRAANVRVICKPPTIQDKAEEENHQ